MHDEAELDDADAGSVIFVELVHSELKVNVNLAGESEKIEVIRWQFPLTHGMLRTAFAAQGLTTEGGVVVDLRRASGLEDDDWWLAMYVTLSAGFAALILERLGNVHGNSLREGGEKAIIFFGEQFYSDPLGV